MNKRTILFFVTFLLIFSFSACTHLTKPSEIVGKNNYYIDWGKHPPTSHDMAKHTIKGKKPFEWWYFDGHLDTGETLSYLNPWSKRSIC